MRKKPIEELTAPNVLHINPYYNLCLDDLKELLEIQDRYEMIGQAFNYGYLQGSKAAKKEMSIKARCK